MFLDPIFSFLRQVPILDFLWVVGSWLGMFRWWRRSGVQPEEKSLDVRQTGAQAVTNQISANLTAATIILAGYGSVLAIGLGKDFPPAALEHLIWGAVAIMLAIVFGLYTLGYIPSVIHRFDVTKKPGVMLFCFVQFNLIAVSALRFLAVLWQLSGHLR